MKSYYKSLFALVVMAICVSSCKNNEHQPSSIEDSEVAKGVSKMADNIARDISTKGPIAWLDYFEDNPGFFMASNGALAFKDYASGRTFIRETLVPNFKSINLKWTNYKIAP